MSHLIDVMEHGRSPVADEVVESTPAGFWKNADCDVSKSAERAAWVLKAGNSVGVTRTSTEAGEVTLHIRPKLDSADVFFMADYAYEQRHDPLRLLDLDDVGLEAVLRDPTACLLVWHARAIRKFASRWLRRDYRARRTTLDGKVKGRILVDRYVSHHLSVGDAARVPCRVQERTQDTPNNRILKAGLRYIAAVSHSLPVPAARRAVLRQVNATLPLFAHVTDIRVSVADIRATSSRGPQRHYASVLAATVSLLQGRLMGDDLSNERNTAAFMWQMPLLFQEAVRGIIGSTEGLILDSGSAGSARIHDAEGNRLRASKVDPDLVLHLSGGGTLLVDTKYKDVLPIGLHLDENENEAIVANRHRIKVARADIYQVVAYRQHEKWPHSSGVLLYPVVLAKDEGLPAPMEVRGFGPPVSLMFMDIGRHAPANLGEFIESLKHYASHAAAHARIGA